MQIEITRSTFTLTPAGLLAVQDGAGSRIVVRSGVLWITQEGDVKDSIVGPGEELTIRKSGRTVITALEAACLTLIEPDTRDSIGHAPLCRAPRRAAEAVVCA